MKKLGIANSGQYLHLTFNITISYLQIFTHSCQWVFKVAISIADMQPALKTCLFYEVI
jgi:uncharacterized membrane protein